MKINDIISEGKDGLWANIHKKQQRIKNGSGERMRKPGSKGAPTAQNFKDAASEGVAEGWKEKVAGATLGAAAIGGIGAAIDKSPPTHVDGVRYEMSYKVPTDAQVTVDDKGRKVHVWTVQGNGIRSGSNRLKRYYHPVEQVKEQGVAEGSNGEYDDESGMAETNLHTIARAAQGLLDTIDDNENLPEWVQEKIAKVEGMMVTAWDYLKSQEEQGVDPRQGVAEATGDSKFDTMMGNIAKPSAVKSLGREEKVHELIRKYFWHKRRADQGSAVTGEHGHDRMAQKMLMALKKMNVDLSAMDPSKLKAIKGEVYEQGVAEGSAGWIGNREKWKEAVHQEHGPDVVFKNYSHPGQPGKRSVNALDADGEIVGVYQRDNKMGIVQPKEQNMSEGAPIVVMPRADRLKKPEPTKVRNQGDIVPPTKPPSTEKRGVKGRPGQRPMPKYDESVAEGSIGDKIKGAAKSVKRAAQGWDKNSVGPGGEKLGDPRAVVNRVKSRTDDEIKNIHSTLNDPDQKFVTRNTSFDKPSKHSPAGLQKRVVDREMKKRGLGEQLEETYHDDDEFFEAYGVMEYNDEMINEAEYQGRKVTLNKPMQGDSKKFKVFVKNPKGNVVKVNFGQKGARIKKNNPGRRKNFRARHNCDNPGPKTGARYWSCRAW